MQILELKSKKTGGDLVPVLIVGAIYGMVIALIVREVVGEHHRAETSDLAQESVRVGIAIQKGIEANGKEKKNKKAGRKKSGTKVRRHHA